MRCAHVSYARAGFDEGWRTAILDGDPVFNALLDPSENGSLWAFELEDFDRSEQAYEPNTAVLRTRLYDRQGQGIEVTDFAPRSGLSP